MDREIKKVDFKAYEGKYDESIFERMEKDPKNVSIEEMRAAMYGYTFTPDYAKGKVDNRFSVDFWKELEGERFLQAIRHAMRSSGKPTKKDEPEIKNASTEEEDSIETEELDPAELDYDSSSPQICLLLKTIDSTGDGKSPETALCVIDVGQEYEYMRNVFPYYLLEIQGQSLTCDHQDCIHFKPNCFGVERIFFDISRRFEVGYHHDE